MFDRTAHAPESTGHKIWDHDTGVKVARALEKHGAFVAGGAFARDDEGSHARLGASMDLLTTGGEGYRGIQPFHESVMARL
jgi:hypothetical protein